MDLIKVVYVVAGAVLCWLLMWALRHKDDAATLNKLKQELDNSYQGSHSFEYSLYRFAAEFLMQKDNSLTTGRFLSLRYCNFINRRKLSNSKESYAHFKSNNEIPLVMIDDSFFRNGKQGMIITSHGIYCFLPFQQPENGYKAEVFLWNDIDSIQLVLKEKHAEMVINDKIIGKTILFNNGNDIDGKEGVILNELLQQLHQRIKQQSIQQGK